MITAKQAEARRRNGCLSRGPKTPEGKAISSRNAVKFGLYATFPSGSPVLPEAGESQVEFEAFEESLLQCLKPVGAVETSLARQIASARWQLQRCPAIEAEIFRSAMRSDFRAQARRRAWITTWIHDGPQLPAAAIATLEASTEPANTLGRAFMRDVRGPRNLDSLRRYESRADRVSFRSLEQLRKLQTKRFSQKEPTDSAISP